MERIILNTENTTSVNFMATYKYADTSEYNVDMQMLDRITGCRYDIYKAHLGYMEYDDDEDTKTRLLSLISKSDGLINNYSLLGTGIIDRSGTLEGSDEITGTADNMDYKCVELNKSDRYVVFDMVNIYTDEALKASDDYIVEFLLNDELIMAQTKINVLPLATPKLYDSKLFTHICQIPVFSIENIKKSSKLFQKALLADENVGQYFKKPKSLKMVIYKRNTSDDSSVTYTKAYESNSFEAVEASSFGLDVSVPADCDYINIRPVVKIPSMDDTISLYEYLFPEDEDNSYKEIPDIDYDITVTELFVDNGPDVNMLLDPYERTQREETRRLTVHTSVSETDVAFRPVLKHSASAVYFDVNIVAKFELDGVEYTVEGSVMDNKPRKYGRKMMRLGFPGVYQKVNVFNKRVNETETQNIVFNNTTVNIDASQTADSDSSTIVNQTVMKGFIQTNRIVVNAANIVATSNIITDED